jgi:hypothetical protein
MATLKEVENAFQPAKEIDTAERFAGRKDAILDGYYALIGKGTNIAAWDRDQVSHVTSATTLGILRRFPLSSAEAQRARQPDKRSQLSGGIIAAIALIFMGFRVQFT